MTRTKTYTLTVAVVLASTLLVGCGSTEDPASEESAPTTATSAPATEESTEQADTSPEAGDFEAGSAPSWATGVVTVGEPMTTVDLDGLSVELRYAGTMPASTGVKLSDGAVLYNAGDTIRYVSVTVTNTTEQVVEMGPGTVQVDLIPEGWPYIGGPMGEASGTPYADLGLIKNAIAELQDSAYPLAACESFSFAVSTAETGELTAEMKWRTPGGLETHEATATVSVG